MARTARTKAQDIPDYRHFNARVAKNDLRAICRESDKLVARVDFLNKTKREPWLILGQAEIDRLNSIWLLRTYLNGFTTDQDHDLADGLRLPLMGLELAGVRNHMVMYEAWVCPNPDMFNVPLPGYNPTQHPMTNGCRGTNSCPIGTPHKLVPSDLYLPPFESELYNHVQGRRIHIEIGPLVERLGPHAAVTPVVYDFG